MARQSSIDQGEEQFASLFGVSARHLRRLFEGELGRTPKQIADQNRLNFARKLITETALPMTDVGYASGFKSLRRFNDAVRVRFHRSPSEIRALSGAKRESDGIVLHLSYRPPLDWHSLMTFYRSHAIRPVETVTDDVYSRVFKMEGVVGSLQVCQSQNERELILSITIDDSRGIFAIVQRVRNMFDLECDPIHISNVFSGCPLMKKLGAKHPGLRLPRGFDPFETSICTILGQLVSTEHAKILIQQLVEIYGEKIRNPFTGGEASLFPTARVLATESLVEIKTTRAGREAIREFSRLVLEKQIRLDATQDPNAFRDRVVRIKGIGPWTAQYISLRAIGDTDAFPATDLILRRVLENQSTLDLECLKPWRAYAAIYLWKEYARTLSNKKRSP